MPKTRGTEKAFDVFLSHNSADKPEVRRLADALEERGLHVWLDERELIPGRSWQEAIEEILQTTRTAAVLVGGSGFGPWHEAEMRGALSEFVDRRLPVIPVLLPDAPEKPALPLFLKGLTWVDLRGGLGAEGLDRLEWGITGRKPKRHKPSAPPPELDLTPWLRHVHSAHSRPIATFRRHRGTALSHLYVELRIAEREAMELWRNQHRGGEKPVSPGERWTLEEVLQLDPKVDGAWITRRWLLYGDPGSGKTTLLRHLAATLADPDRGQEPRWIPIFESLPRFLREHSDRPVFYPDALAARFCQVAGGDAQLWRAQLDLLARAGRLLLMFDGLDEVPREKRGAVDGLLGGVAACHGWENAPIVVSSRPIGGHSPGAAFRQLELLPFADADRLEFLSKWLGKPGMPDVERAGEALGRLHRDPSVRELAGNPLYLTLLATLFEDGVEIPERRSELHRKIFDFLLEAKHRKDVEPIEHSWAVEVALRELAWTMTHDGFEAEPLRALGKRLDESETVQKAFSRIEEWRGKPQRFLADVAEKTSILGPHDGEDADWRFWHRTFREALTAEQLAELHEEEGEAGLLAHARERTGEDAGRWAEPYALLAGRLAEPDGLILSLVEVNRALGLRALATVQGLERETITTILEKLHEKREYENIKDWEARARVYRRIPELLGEALAALKLLERLRRETSNGNDLFFLEEVMIEIGKRWPEAVKEVERRRARFFDHLGKPPAELFQQVVTKDGEVELWAEIPTGTFLMGSPETEEERYPDEGPQHEVRISRPFKMAVVPVTNAQYRAFDPSHEGPAAHPVVDVTWYEASAFCRWLEHSGYAGARLPTEAEWEYACRAKTTTRFWSGDREADLAEIGWYTENSWDGTHPVGELRANRWKLYDMHGNVWEWCIDAWDKRAYEKRAAEKLVEPVASDADVWVTAAKRVIRGGFWDDVPPRCLRAAFRDADPASDRDLDRGFRVVLGPAPERTVGPRVSHLEAYPRFPRTDDDLWRQELRNWNWHS